MTKKSIIKLQSEEHEIINPDLYATPEEYVVHLMHLSDYQRAQDVVNDKVVLDLGCNSGYGTNLLSDRCKSIVGVDVSPTAIKTAKSKYTKPNLNFQIVDGINLPFKDNSFDAITSFQVIEHLENYDSYLCEIKRVLRPNGILLLTTPNAEIRVRPGQKPWNRFHVHEFHGNELEALLLKYFHNTQVIGQFAEGPAYSTEYERCTKARDAVVDTKDFQSKKSVLSILPEPIVKIGRIIKRRLISKNQYLDSKEFKNNFKLSDFYYKDDDLDNSLTLIACCSKSITSKNIALQAFVS